MKISLHELKEKTSMSFDVDYNQKIKGNPDILSIQPAKINMDIKHIDASLELDIHVDVNMDLACAKTLKPVPYHLSFDEIILFGQDEDADFPLTDPLEISDIVYGYILSLKPYVIYHPDATHVSFEETKSPHPAFADLDKIVKK
ncbi:MAG: hypothetical protein CVV61_06250 [Tenericutes bacterium HGW-Tenericutes-6]|jgi:uncharacterized protein|nr:MAG: hypothetical protein CVV61_06250 [Tenericutes bacterium HGW-Tenericutes-6]